MFERAKTKIDKYEKKYQLDLSYAIKNSFWVYLRQAIALITGLAVSVVFARLASKEVFGQYNFILALLAIVSLLSIPGLNTAVMISSAKGYEGSYKRAVKTSFLWSLLGIPALLGAGAYCYYYNSQIIGICLMISSIFFPLLNAPNTWDSFLQGKKRFDVATKYGSFQATVNAAAIVAILFLNANNLVFIFTTHLITSSFVTCTLFMRSLKYIENNKEEENNSCIKYGYFMTTTNIVGYISKNIDKILIGSLVGAPELAVYAIALMIPTKLKDILKLPLAPFTPKLSQDGIEMKHVLEKLRRLFLPLALILLGGSALYLLFIDDVIILLFSTKYAESIIYARILLLYILISPFHAFVATFTIVKKKKKAIITAFHVYPFLYLFITCAFIYLWGIMGAIWSLIIGMAVQALLILVSGGRGGR
jgi:PST family polysaccharide transporter